MKGEDPTKTSSPSGKSPTKRLQALDAGRVLRAFGHSVRGLRQALSEAAFQQELLLGLVTLPLAFAMDMPASWKCLILSSFLLVLVVEVLNTAVEKVVDLASPAVHPLAGQAKDLGSAAVFLAIAAYAFVWIFALFW